MQLLTTQRFGRPQRSWLRVLLLAVLLLTACAQGSTMPTATSGLSAQLGGTPTVQSTVARSATTSASVSASTPGIATATGGRTATSATLPATRTPVGTPTSVTTSAATPTGDTSPTEAAITSSSNSGGGGGNNQVRVINKKDGALRIRGNVDFNRIPGPNVEPVNLAYAYSSCTDCQTIAVALQINLISRTATRIAPQNVAIALNENCLRCVTVARALQYTYQVDDPKETPKEISDLLKEMDQTLNEISRDKNITLPEAEARINAVIAQFKDLATSLNDQREDDTRSNDRGTPTSGPNVTPTSGPTASPATGTAQPPPTATAGAAPSPTPLPATATPPTPTITPTATTP